MTGNNHNTPNPYHAKPRVKPKADPTPIGRSNNGAGDKPQVNRFDRIDRHIHHLKWLVAINLVLSAALLVVVMMVLDG